MIRQLCPAIATVARRLKALPCARAGVAVTETALVLPFFLGAGLAGIELANYSLTTLRVGQLAVQVADNASRIGDISTLENRKIYEADINDLLLGAKVQAGSGMDLYENGRVIVSSLEVNADGDQYIHWQRCMGTLKIVSSYGKEGDELPDGIGPDDRKVLAQSGDAVVFVEIAYTYRPLISEALMGARRIESTASYTVRSSRDLSQIYQVEGQAHAPVSSCDKFTDTTA
ncbi:TadE/TadG family type IV pilus assembly protein [Novosphingobium decolorationis]|uniref:Pilus assembly protein n=1 Tax=Novosphingobium decolorationis TaxID=2698673 RepID=A0ABX8E3B1_9SPHN|nr:hypothetical protein [Novosphingobium decolorationis]QVM82691.1 hypothetical protein HT578_02330 [Novosphingobium decolorationis]